jgi:uncharacterized protein YcfJ
MTLSQNSVKSLFAAATLALLAGCASPAFDKDNENAARNRGAAGGALLGATMGVLTGEPELAVKGAVAGGVAGGVAGSMKDLDDSRETGRTETLADGIKQDNRSDPEKRADELEAEIRIRELEQKLAEMEKAQQVESSQEG